MRKGRSKQKKARETSPLIRRRNGQILSDRPTVNQSDTTIRSNVKQPVSKDRLTKERRSWNMSRIKGKNTSPELIVRRLLHKMGYRFRLHVRIPIPNDHPSTKNAQPRRSRSVSVDIVLPKYKTAIFVHGCFWHRHEGCKNCTTPTNRREWWLAKLKGNVERDKLHQAALKRLGWKTVVIWECQSVCAINQDLETMLYKVAISGAAREQT